MPPKLRVEWNDLVEGLHLWVIWRQAYEVRNAWMDEEGYRLVPGRLIPRPDWSLYACQEVVVAKMGRGFIELRPARPYSDPRSRYLVVRSEWSRLITRRERPTTFPVPDMTDPGLHLPPELL